jgi:hypothetical protein
MRRYVIWAVFLLIAPFADAGMKLSVNGQVAPDSIYLDWHETITLDILVEDGTLYVGGDLQIALSNGQGSLDDSEITFITNPLTRQYFEDPPLGWYNGNRAWDMQWSVFLSLDTDVRITGVNMPWSTSANTVGPYTLMDGLVFHCDEPTDVIIDLIAYGLVGYVLYTGDPPEDAGLEVIYTKGTIIDSIHVTQIPEPATLVLLGLGALGLFRRRKL